MTINKQINKYQTKSSYNNDLEAFQSVEEKKVLIGPYNEKGIWKDDPEGTAMTDVGVLYRPGWGTRKVQGKGQGHGQNYQREKQEIFQKQVCKLRKPRV